MTPFLLSSKTILAIQTAVANNGTPGVQNANYVAAYQDIYNDLLAQNATNPVTPGVLAWFRQAPLVDQEQWVSSAPGLFIWNYTEAAAAIEGQAITTQDLQNASNAIAFEVFSQLTEAHYVFTDADVDNGFAMTRIVRDDASAGISVIQKAYPAAKLDYAIWGGTLFATTELGDPTYFNDYQIDLTPGSRDATAMLAGLFAGSAAVYGAGLSLTGALDLDFGTISSILSGTQKTVLAATFVLAGPGLTTLGFLGASVGYLWNVATRELITLTTSDNSPGQAYAYDPNRGGLLTFSEGTAGAGTLALPDGAVLKMGGSADLKLSAITADNGTDLQSLLDYLSQSGDPLTAAQLDQQNFNSLNPTGTAHAITGTVQNVNNASAIVTYTPGTAAGAVINGQTTAVIIVSDKQVTVPATNVIQLGSNNVDLSQDTINGVQTLNDSFGVTVSLTENEFNAFRAITGGGTIIAANGGTFSLLHPSVTGNFNLTATDLISTTLIGNNQNDQTLTASMFGNDSLTAGNGINDTLVAGDGINTLSGGNGGDTFVANGLVPGSVVHGGTGANILEAEGDITGATIAGVQSLEAGDLTLTGSQFNNFKTIYGGGTLTLTTGGSYSLLGKTAPPPGSTSPVAVNMDAGSLAGTTLTGDNAEGEVLTASATGNDKLVAGNGDNDRLIAGGGANTLVAGNGSDDQLIAGTGVDTLVGAGGFFTLIEAPNGLAPGSTITGGYDTDLAAKGDISGVSLSGLDSIITYDITMTASQLPEVGFLQSPGGVGDFFAATGGTYDLGQNGLIEPFNMTALSTDGTTLSQDHVSGVTLTASKSGNDILTIADTSGATLDVSNTSGNDDAVAQNNTSGVTVNASHSSGADTLVAQLNSSNDTINAQYSSGQDTIVGSGGSNNVLDARFSTGKDLIAVYLSSNNTLYAGNGIDVLLSEGGSDNTFVVNGPMAAGSSIEATQGTTGHILEIGSNSNLTGVTIAGIGTLEVLNGTAATLTAAQLNAFGDVTATGTEAYVQAPGAGSYSLAGKTVVGKVALVASAAGNDTLAGGSGPDIYQFGPAFGQDTINNAGGTSAKGEVDFLGATTDEKLWFQKRGNNLQIDLLGTTDQATISNWYGSAGADVQKFTAGGLTLDSQVSTLVSAMATYAAANPGFHPATASAMPTNSALQSTITSSWHH